MNDIVLIINGSLRIKGNTDIIVERIIEGAQSSGVKPKLIQLRDKRIGNCKGCYTCMNTSECSQHDDMTEIRTAMENSDLLVLASPLYWCGVTGLMKTFIDRLFFYYHPHNRTLISGKKALIVTTMNQKDVEHEADILAEFYRRLLDCLGVRIVDMAFFAGVMGKGEVLKSPQYLEKAYRIGCNLLRY
jgi:multimeric flavodoxin WrbA